MVRKQMYQFVGVTGAAIGLLSLLFAAMMGLGTIIVTPLGFLFGLAEAGNSETLPESLINLFSHVAPGMVGAAITIALLIFAILLFWGSRSVWSRTKGKSNEASP